MVDEDTKKIRKKKMMYDGTPDGKPYGRQRDYLPLDVVPYKRFLCKNTCHDFWPNKFTYVQMVETWSEILLLTLIHDADSKIAPPINEQVKLNQEAIGSRHPNVKDVWAAADGLKSTLEAAANDCE